MDHSSGRFALAAAAISAASLFPGLAAAAIPPSFAIMAPTQGAIVDSPATLRIKLQGAQIGQPIDGLDHLHIQVDKGPEIATYRNRPLQVPLTPGQHAISVELAGPTREGLLPPASVTFTVR